MVQCEYCDASFAGEDEYLVHLRDAHEGELGAIDRRRVAELEDDGGDGVPTGPAVLGLVLVIAIGLVVYVTVFMGSGSGSGLPDSGDDAVISQVETEPASSTDHVDPGTDIDYERVPPTGGPHYETTADAGFYEEPLPYGDLVHSLEHGAVVVYYDPVALSPAAREDLQLYATSHTGTWRSFIAVPNPEDDPEAAYVLTAWEKRLTMDEYDGDAVEAFVAEYIGRGPENPVRDPPN